MRTALLLFLALALGTTSALGQVRLDRHGITLQVPHVWQQIPDSIVSLMTENAARDLNLDVEYVAGFQPERAERWFELPYVLFQVEASSHGQSVRSR